MAARYLGRFRCTDTPGSRAVRVRDQEGEGEEPEGELLCRLMEGRDGNFMGHDAKGRVLRVKRGRDGALEIRHLAETGDQADPDVVGSHPGAGAGAVAWGRGADPASAATGDGFSRYVKTAKWEHHGAALTAYQKRLDAYYGK